MNRLHKTDLTGDNKIDSEEGQRTVLCSNKLVNRCPSSVEDMSEDRALDYLARILIDELYEQIKNENLSRQSNKETSSDLLPGINQGTG